MIPIFRPAISEEEIAAVAEVLRSGWLGPGKQVAEFEKKFAEACEVSHAISMSSGTAALSATLGVLQVGPGDEIIVPSFTYVSVVHVILSAGATPVFADIEPAHLTLDPDDVERRITKRTKGIVAVHHGGQLADLDRLQEIASRAGIFLVDDAAHAAGARYHGRPVGSLCLMTCFSFSAVKNLSTGDGGMVTTNDPDLARELGIFRSLGLDRDTWSRYGSGAVPQRNRWAYDIAGSGQRIHMNDIAAAMGLTQLQRLPQLNARRACLVMGYESAFKDIATFRSVQPRRDTSPSWHMYTMVMQERDLFVDRMREAGITVGVHYHPLHLYAAFEKFRTELPVTDDLWRKVTTFPLYPTMTEVEHQRVISATLQIAAGRLQGAAG